MGLYDNVIFETECPKCGNIVKNFQTKDYNCTLDSLDFRFVDGFYSMCPNCKVWVSVELKEETILKLKALRLQLTKDDYEITAEEEK